ncbi:LysR substrate-binding domain-containing protein [Pseudomonas shirazensis]|uniref:LysR substrate-binding domain-containing protein n=1 Tax=Pseudomonas shirazensis TaxID=2745494 RepID=UPI003D2D2F11
MNLDMNQLRTFVTVAELKSFSRASEKLCRVQSAVSQQIQKLEAHLGADLFVRGKKALALTPKGDEMLVHAVRILEMNDQAVATMTDMRYKGQIKVGTSDTYVSSFFSDIAKRCAARFPDMEIEVHCGYSGQIWERYQSGELDVVLTQGRPPAVSSELLHSEELKWVCAKGSNALAQNPVPLALFTKGCGDRDLILQALQRVKKAYRVSYNSTSYAGVVAALKSGFYVSAVLMSTVDEDFQVLTAVDGFPVIGNLDITLAYHDKSKGSLSSAFADASRSYFGSMSASGVLAEPKAVRSQ